MNFTEMPAKIFSTPLQIGVLELPFNLLELLLLFLLPLFLFTLLYRLLLGTLRKLLGRTSWQEQTIKRILKWGRVLLRLLYIGLLFILIGRLFGAKIFEYLRRFYSVLDQPLINSGNTRVTFVTILLTIPVFYVASWAGRATH